MVIYRLGLDHLVGTPALKPYMHGYFISMELYDTARLIANPYVYEEHRERAIREKIDKLAETRIRTRKDAGVKVNKALAEKIRKEEEREKKRTEKKARRSMAAADGSTVDVDGDVDMDAQAEPDAEGAGEAKSAKASLLSDPRFKDLFENPEFEVDKESREFALLNPSSVAQRQNQRGAAASGSTRARTAVESEESASDRPSSSEDESDSASDARSQSEDSDAAGGAILSVDWARRPIADDPVSFRLQSSGPTTFVPAWPRATAASGNDRSPVRPAMPTCASCPCGRRRARRAGEWRTRTRPLASGGRRARQRARVPRLPAACASHPTVASR